MFDDFIENIKRQKPFVYSFIFIIFIVSFFSIKSHYEAYVDPDNYLETPITQNNLNNIVSLAFDKTPDLNAQKIDLLETLRSINLGQLAHLRYLESKNKSDKANALASQSNFKELNDKLFYFIEKNHFTLSQFFNYIDKYSALKSNFDKPNNAFYKEVDKYNLAFQGHIDEIPVLIEKKLNKMFNIKFVAAETYHEPSEYSMFTGKGKEYLFPIYYLKFKGVNTLSEPIRDYSYTLIFKNKKSEIIHSYKSGLSNTYVKKHEDITVIFKQRYDPEQDSKTKTDLQAFLSQEKANENAIYSALEDGLVDKIEVNVTKIHTAKHDYPNMEEFSPYHSYRNQHYKTPAALNGEGPYSNKEMVQKQQQLKSEWEQLQLDNFGQLYLYPSYLSGFYSN